MHALSLDPSASDSIGDRRNPGHADGYTIAHRYPHAPPCNRVCPRSWDRERWGNSPTTEAPIAEWYSLVEKESLLMSTPMSREQLRAHLPHLFHDTWWFVSAVPHRAAAKSPNPSTLLSMVSIGERQAITRRCWWRSRCFSSLDI
jgi:hypothetical protein